MAVKSRKDSKGYALKTGECQRNDGRYSSLSIYLVVSLRKWSCYAIMS